MKMSIDENIRIVGGDEVEPHSIPIQVGNHHIVILNAVGI